MSARDRDVRAICGHSDIEPANILIEDESDRIRPADFGLARLDDGSGATDSSTVETAGTPWYMVPEQMLGETPDARSDIYALGATFYKLLSGKKPHDGGTAAVVAIRKHSEAPLRAELSARMAHVVERCLEHEPNDRFSRTSELGGALEPSVRRSAISVSNHSCRRWGHRNFKRAYGFQS